MLRNARLVNVCSGECYPADVALADGIIVGIGAEGMSIMDFEERDLQGRWLAPGLIDGHMHIESTMLCSGGIYAHRHAARCYRRDA